MQHQASAVCGAMESLGDNVSVGVLGFTQVLSLYELPLLAKGVLRAQLFKGTHEWQPDELAALTRSAPTYTASMSSLRPHLGALRAALISGVSTHSNSRRVGRSVGSTLSVACALLAAAAPQPSHLLLLTGGAPSHGSGALLLQDRSAALAFYRSLALTAAKQLTAYVSND